MHDLNCVVRCVYRGLTVVLIAAVMLIPSCGAQDLAPRAYLITPLHSNAINTTYSFYNGGLDMNGVVPVHDARGRYSMPNFGLYHSFSLFGRSANLAASIPYGVGTFKGTVEGTEEEIYRLGLGDVGLRFTVNVLGGPAMPLPEFLKWRQRTVLGVTLKVIAPTGQYDPTKLVNWGINRWAFKPEIGYSRRVGKWLVDGYGGAWLFTTSQEFYSQPTPKRRRKTPLVPWKVI